MRRFVTLAACWSMLAAWQAHGAEAAPVNFGPIAAGVGEIAQYVLTLEQAVGGQPLTLHIWVREGKFRQAWATSPAKPGYCYALIASHTGFYNVPPEIGLRQENGKLTGAVRLEGSCDYGIAATVSGTKVSGEYRAFAIERGQDRAEAGSGKLTGSIRAAADLAGAVSPLAKGACVPGFRNNASGVGFETGQKLVENPQEARVVWKSEDLIFPPYHEGINFRHPCGLQGGHASPVLYDGKIYLNYFWGIESATDDPAGVEQAIAGAKVAEQTKGKAPLYIPVELIRRKYARTADQAMVCVDAGTGRTLWRAVFPNEGWNISRGGSDCRHKLCGPSSKAASHLTPCVGDGMVFFKDTGGSIYALEANTGALKWRVGERVDPANRRGGQNGTGGAQTDTLQYADGVVATLKSQLTGFDAKTGNILWQQPQVLAGQGATALRWVNKGKEFFLTTGGYCIEAKTGKILWKIEDWEGLGCQFAASEDQLIVEYARGVAGYRISPEKAEKLWESKDITRQRMVFPVLYRGHAYLRTKSHPQGIEQKLWSGDFSPMKDGGKLTQDWLTLCLDMQTGKPVGAAYGSKSFASITAGDGRIFNCCAVTVAYQDADPTKYRDLPFDKEKGSYRGPADHGSPCTVLLGCPETGGAYADGRFFSRTFDGIVCYDLRKQ